MIYREQIDVSISEELDLSRVGHGSASEVFALKQQLEAHHRLMDPKLDVFWTNEGSTLVVSGRVGNLKVFYETAATVGLSYPDKQAFMGELLHQISERVARKLVAVFSSQLTDAAALQPETPPKEGVYR